MSYFKNLKLTKKGEQLQAKINGNLSETLVFTKAKMGSGKITSDEEIRFLTDVKEAWETASISKCELQGNDNTVVALELQFSNKNLLENKIFREIGLYARGNDSEEILYAYANAGDNYDYIPLMKDSPHSFIITIYFTITSGTKINANIDLNSYISLKKFNEEMSKKANKTDYASGSQYGLVQYGIEEGKALEGHRLAQLAGCYGFGGDIQTQGVKNQNYIYWDNNTKKMYKCLKQNSDVSASVNNYIPLDNNSLLDRLENLTKDRLIFSGKNYTKGTHTLPISLSPSYKYIYVVHGNPSYSSNIVKIKYKDKHRLVYIFGDGGGTPEIGCFLFNNDSTLYYQSETIIGETQISLLECWQSNF